ncbi:MAG: HEPN domain-containing protein [Ginsengibacter sp.]
MSKRSEAIRARIKKSAEFMREANILLQNRLYYGFINRLYYSCFHVTKALLLTRDLVSKTHSGTVTLLNQKFVRENVFDAAQAAFFQELMNERIQSDYDEFMIFDEDSVTKFIEPSKLYVDYVIQIIEKYFEENPDDIDKPSLFP